MKLDLEMAVPPPVPTADDPFALGWRYTPDGDPEWRVPLTEEDLLYPQEADFVVNNEAHIDDLRYLVAVFRERIAGREGLRVLGDHMVDFEVPGLRILGPDVIVFNGEAREWDRNRAVFPVKKMGARPLIVVEITSPTTRRKDLTDKPNLFYRAGVPLFVLIDLPYGGGKRPSGITAFQAGPTEYEPLPPEPDGRVWLEVVEVFLRSEGNRVVCYTPDGQRIEDDTELRKSLAAEKARADAEKARADAAARKLADLEVELKRLRGDTTN
ncbi:Uma2 family endonuclease [Gemmata sp.]|uniref:Uma2 family endonuclease n=1 Tax=Gemmata sp. TaxID=1914242 RepID=UPI003F700D1A